MSKDRMFACREIAQSKMADLLTEREGLPNGVHVAYELYREGDSLMAHGKKCREWYQAWKAAHPGNDFQSEKVLKAMMGVIHEIHVREVKALVRDRGRA